jgi:hypothetical protein
MADANAASLVKVGPFQGVDYTTAGPSVASGVGSAASNVSLTRVIGAMSTSRGRTNVTTLTGGGTIQALNPLNFSHYTSPSSNTSGRLIVAAITGGSAAVVAYNPDTSTQLAISSGSSTLQPYTQATSFDGALYTNTGYQIRYNPSTGGFNQFSWTYPNVFLSLTSYTMTPTTTGTVNITSGTYYWNFTTFTTFPDGTTQESPPWTLSYPTSSGYTESTSFSAAITFASGNWSGTNADGSTYVTYVYRQSANQPTWYYVGTATGAATTAFVDNNSDTNISANAQLQFRSNAPMQIPVGTLSSTYNSYMSPAVVFTHKNRAWIFIDFQSDTETNNVAQCQLWFSDYGAPWSLFSATQVLLIGQESDNAAPLTATLYNDMPMAGCSLSSIAILFKRRSTYILYGDDQTTFLPRKMFDIGCVSGASATVCEDVVCWLSEEGPQITDGQVRQYIGDQVRNLLDTIPQSDWQKAVGWFNNRTWYLSFPSTGITLRYYLQTKQWLPTLPYGTNAAYGIASESAPVGTPRLNETIAARPSSLVIDAWATGDTDLGGAITGTWTSPYTDSGAPGVQKEYQWVVINAPVQTGVTATVQLVIDQDTTQKQFSWTFDLSQGPTLVATIGPGINPSGYALDNTGFMAQVFITLNNTASATTAAVIYSVEIHGSIQRSFVASNSGVT